jgi:hypothetical protein
VNPFESSVDPLGPVGGMDPGPLRHAVRVTKSFPQLAKLVRLDKVFDVAVAGVVVVVLVARFGVGFQDVDDVDFLAAVGRAGLDIELNLSIENRVVNQV